MIRIAPSPLAPAGAQETLLDAVTNGRLGVIGNLDAPISRRSDAVARNGSWHVVLRGSPGRPQVVLVSDDSEIAALVAALVEERRVKGTTPVRQALQEIRIVRDRRAVRVWLEAMDRLASDIRNAIQVIWRLDDEIDQWVFRLYQVPAQLVSGIARIVS